jgi:membrane fusion protein (multidrug efflux system)
MMNRSEHNRSSIMDEVTPHDAAPAGPLARKARLNRGLPLAGFLLAVCVLGGGVYGFVKRKQQQVTWRVERDELASPSVAITRPVREEAGEGTILLPAEIKPFAEAPIYGRANGYVKSWHADIGQTVRKGDLLVEVDAPDLQQELLQARAQVKQAEAALALAETTATRWGDLLKSSSVSKQEVAEKEGDLAVRKANLEAARATVRRAEELLSFNRIVAPFDGTVTRRQVDVGDLVKLDNGRELFHLAQIKTLRVFVHVPQTLAAWVKPGQGANVLVSEVRNREFPAKVVRTAGALNPETRTLLTELELDNSKEEILSGSFAQVRLQDSKDHAGALVVPSTAILLQSSGPHVAVVGAGDKIELRKITIARDLGPTMEIENGVQEADRIVANPSDFLTNGMIVHIASEAHK